MKYSRRKIPEARHRISDPCGAGSHRRDRRLTIWSMPIGPKASMTASAPATFYWASASPCFSWPAPTSTPNEEVSSHARVCPTIAGRTIRKSPKTMA